MFAGDRDTLLEDRDAFGDVEAFLADYAPEAHLTEISEEEAAEALAVAWKDCCQEIQKHHQSRKFGKPELQDLTSVFSGSKWKS